MVQVRLAVVALLCATSCVPVVTPSSSTKTNVYLSFSSDWNCVTDSRETCQHQIAENLRHIFRRYDIGFWTTSERSRVDGLTVFFEASDPELWGAGPKTVGWSAKRCTPKVLDGLIVGASAIFQCGDDVKRGPEYCADVVAHEIGHLVGLEHVRERNDLMNAIPRKGNTFGLGFFATEVSHCRSEQNDAELLWSAFGESRAIY